ncbi:MAG TPA: hypothetical protein VFU63_02980 [Ktedonobacterales bacterium]|nr:hypothetical protein [Ktedonobacterales bacterium]
MDIEFLREVAPFLIGVITIPPLVLLATRRSWSSISKFATAFVLSLILGGATSYMAGELAVGMPTALLAVMIDTSLVYTGSQLSWWLVWKPIFILLRPNKPATAARGQK